MDTVQNKLITLEEIPADRQLVEQLFARRSITAGGRDYALKLLFPAKNWGLWIARLLTALGVTLVLAGVIYFFAFNWAAIPDLVKLGSVEAALAGCLGAGYFCGLQSRAGKMFVLAASVLTGVFLAVFGQVYQTGADAWTLFGVWAALMTPWVVVMRFAPLAMVWLTVLNIAVYLFWEQCLTPGWEWDFLIYGALAIVNAAAAGAREYLEPRAPWLSQRWTRTVPVSGALFFAIIPVIVTILDWHRATTGMEIATAISTVLLCLSYGMYRFVKPDMHALAATLLTACIIAEVLMFKVMDTDIFRSMDALQLLLQGVFAIALFGAAVVWLRLTAKKMENAHV